MTNTNQVNRHLDICKARAILEEARYRGIEREREQQADSESVAATTIESSLEELKKAIELYICTNERRNKKTEEDEIGEEQQESSASAKSALLSHFLSARAGIRAREMQSRLEIERLRRRIVELEDDILTVQTSVAYFRTERMRDHEFDRLTLIRSRHRSELRERDAHIEKLNAEVEQRGRRIEGLILLLQQQQQRNEEAKAGGTEQGHRHDYDDYKTYKIKKGEKSEKCNQIWPLAATSTAAAAIITVDGCGDDEDEVKEKAELDSDTTAEHESSKGNACLGAKRILRRNSSTAATA